MKTMSLLRNKGIGSFWSLVLLATAGSIPTAALAVVPVNGAAPTLIPVAINASPGDQNDPHVSGDWAAYASDVAIRYYNFSTAVDAQIPMGASARDLLSDISGSKIVFSRVVSGVGTGVMVFDTPSAAAPIEIDAAPQTIRLGSAIGGNTVAYVDFGLEANGELVIHDLVTATSVRITNDTNPDQSPSVSPDGSVVTWEHCNSSLSNCDIWQAVKSGATWTVGIVSDSTAAEANPDTNGTLVVYDSYRNGNSDLFWRPVAGGTEVQLQLAAFEGNPSIAGYYIAFESRLTLGSTSDIYVYDIIGNRLYQITNTPLVTEQLNDITVLPNGDLRVVWASDEDGQSSRNVKGATFTLPRVTFTDRDQFIQQAGPLTQIDFDHAPCGNPLAVPSTGLVAGSIYNEFGVNFLLDSTIYSAPIDLQSQLTASPPNFIRGAPTPIYLPALLRPQPVVGQFTTGVTAVGITNVGTGAVLRLLDAQGQLITTIATDTDPLLKDFVGVVSAFPIASFELTSEFASVGAFLGGDDLLFSRIAPTGACQPLAPTVTVTDTVPPAGSIAIDGNAAWTNSPSAALTLTCTDAGSGCSMARFSDDNATWLAWEAYLPTRAWTLTGGDGTKTVYVQLRDVAGNVSAAYSDTIVLDATPPVLTVPATITVNATSPSGAAVSYVVTATDAVDPNPTVSCAPASGSTFPVGMTAVACTATDAFGNSATAGFNVIVKGAPDQITALIALVQSFNIKQGIENSLDAKLQNVFDALNAAKAGYMATACSKLGAFINEVLAQSGKALTTAQANQLIAAANQVKASLGCP